MAEALRQAFDESTNRLSELARALAHPARVAILRTLAARRSCICGEIVEVLPLAQSTVSQHLKELKACGLIVGEVDGPRRCYCINWERLDELFSLVREFAVQLSPGADPDRRKQEAHR